MNFRHDLPDDGLDELISPIIGAGHSRYECDVCPSLTAALQDTVAPVDQIPLNVGGVHVVGSDEPVGGRYNRTLSIAIADGIVAHNTDRNMYSGASFAGPSCLVLIEGTVQNGFLSQLYRRLLISLGPLFQTS
ncbi:MAG: hypothetical protein JO334_08035 [Verrucomicrobia bacterium]|nr:hypothetical protein [Verrucomicrobiota bacterium]